MSIFGLMAICEGTNIKIFLAEDDEDDRLLFHEAMNEINSKIEVIESFDGVHLLENLREYKIDRTDLIFLDLNMPLMNGFECLDKIKKDPLLKSVRTIIFSTTAEDDYVEKSFQKGAFMYIKKPNSFQDLINTIKTIINLEEENRPSRKQFVFQSL